MDHKVMVVRPRELMAIVEVIRTGPSTDIPGWFIRELKPSFILYIATDNHPVTCTC